MKFTVQVSEATFFFRTISLIHSKNNIQQILLFGTGFAGRLLVLINTQLLNKMEREK